MPYADLEVKRIADANRYLKNKYRFGPVKPGYRPSVWSKKDSQRKWTLSAKGIKYYKNRKQNEKERTCFRTDWYVKKRLRKLLHISTIGLSQELIMLKREQLKLHRLIQKRKNHEKCKRDENRDGQSIQGS
jgi:hypothetical protein